MKTTIWRKLLSNSPRQGFALVEACISIVLTALALLSVMMAFSMTVNSVLAARDMEATTFVALGVLNELEGVRFDEMTSYRTRSMDFPAGFNGSVTFSPSNPTQNDESVMITARITKNTGRDNSVTLTRLVSNNGFKNAGN